MIKLFEQYNEYSQIKDWLDKMKIDNYTINDDLTVDVNDNVNLAYKNLAEIPVKFGKVKGYFTCYYNTILTTLKGCPKYVGGDFNCSNNRLTSLMYMPKIVDGNIIIGSNPLPDEVLSFIDLHTLIRCQDEYGIWNTDGSFNKGRWSIFYKEYYEGKLNDDND